MISVIAHNKTLWMVERGWTTIMQLVQKHFPLEVGGVLVGYQPDERSVVVTDVIGPGPRAKHRRSTFRPDHAHQQEQLDARYRQSNGVEVYLGDWHSHPNGFDGPSRKDLRVLRRIAETEEAQMRNPIMIVVAGGPEEHSWNPRCIQFVSYRKSRLFAAEYQLSELTLRRFHNDGT
jgi:integrative and conjugative element protein (TIGR02256 family)